MGTRKSILTILCALTCLAAAPYEDAVAQESQSYVYVHGEVKNPGAYPWKAGITVAQAVQQAGGFTEVANRSRVTVARGEREIVLSREDLAETENREGVRLEPGDVVRVERGSIQVEGEVRSPGHYGLEHATVRQALIAAGGPTDAGDLEAAYIARGGRVIRVDARKVLASGAGIGNPPLEPGDVLHIPRAHARVMIVGEVRRPGAYDLQPGKVERLDDLIAEAGGPTNNARLSRIELRRAPRADERAQTQTINLEDPGTDELQRNPVLKSGDYVVVPAERRGRGFGVNEVYQIGILVLTLISILSR